MTSRIFAAHIGRWQTIHEFLKCMKKKKMNKTLTDLNLRINKTWNRQRKRTAWMKVGYTCWNGISYCAWFTMVLHKQTCSLFWKWYSDILIFHIAKTILAFYKNIGFWSSARMLSLFNKPQNDSGFIANVFNYIHCTEYMRWRATINNEQERIQ